jgi:C1A family cysteine protease
MALDLSLDDLQAAIANSNGRWRAGSTPLTNLPETEKLRRLGAAPPGGTLELQERELQAALEYWAAQAAGAPWANPNAWDWRNVSGANFVTPVRDQGSCGAALAFASIATTESMVRIDANDPGLAVDLSEAQLFYCDAAKDGVNCDGGWWPDKALQCLVSSGVADEGCFPYTPGDQPCTLCADAVERSTYVTAYHTISNSSDMKSWLATKGPLIATLSVYDDFLSYESGVYHHVTGIGAMGHCVCVVGYDENEQCWICKNSWGLFWGEAGFFRIGYGQCGIDAEMWTVDGVVSNKVDIAG